MARNSNTSTAPVEAEVTPTETETVAPVMPEGVDPEQWAAFLAFQARPPRKSREVRPTEKQLAFLSALNSAPETPVSDLCTTAGATATSHGFVFRLIENGYVELALTERGRSYLPTEQEAEAEAEVEGEGDSTES